MSKTIHVLGRTSSVNVQKVMWCAAELGLEVDRHDYGGAFGGNDTADYLAKNPNGKIPVLITATMSCGNQTRSFVTWSTSTTTVPGNLLRRKPEELPVNGWTGPWANYSPP